jgi:hypothetical protein
MSSVRYRVLLAVAVFLCVLCIGVFSFIPADSLDVFVVYGGF